MRSHGRISRLFCAHWGERTALNAARTALEALIPRSSESAIPVQVETAAKYVGIEHVIEVEMTGCDGLLSSTPSGAYVASIRKGQGDVRKRFTLAHEIGHAIVYRSIGSQRTSGDGEMRCGAQTSDERDEERLCDLLAAELLMPREQLVRTIAETGVCAETVPEIAQRFGVSLQAVSRKLTEVVPYDIGLALWSASDDNARVFPKWYVTKKGTLRLEHAIQVGEPGSACFSDEMVRGWRWIPIHGQMDKYFVDVNPIRSTPKTWLMLTLFDSPPEHIMAEISRRTITGSIQLPLIPE